MNNSNKLFKNILIIDTATEACSAAILTGEDVYHHFEVCPQQQSQRILPIIRDLCEQADIKIQQIDAIGFGHGPGSFTGVRIAIGTVQGLALGLDVPVVGVSTLSAMAYQVAAEHSEVHDVLVAIDARMGEVYFAHFRSSSGTSTKIELVTAENVVSPDDVAEYAAGFPNASYAGTGWQAYPELHPYIKDKPITTTLPNARFMLPETLAKLASQQFDTAETATPVYLRDTVTWKKLPGRE